MFRHCSCWNFPYSLIFWLNILIYICVSTLSNIWYTACIFFWVNIKFLAYTIHLRAVTKLRYRLTSIGISMLKIRRFHNRLKFIMGIPTLGKTVFIFRRNLDEYRSLRIIILSVEQFPTEHHCVGNANIGWGNSFVQQSDVLIEERAFAFIVFGVPVILTQDQLGLCHKTAYEIKEEFYVYIH